jgi:hypothetical protein
MVKTLRTAHNSKINIAAPWGGPYHTGMEAPPSPLYSFKDDNHIDQHYATEQDAVSAAVYSVGYLQDARGDDGSYIVRFDLRV